MLVNSPHESVNPAQTLRDPGRDGAGGDAGKHDSCRGGGEGSGGSWLLQVPGVLLPGTPVCVSLMGLSLLMGSPWKRRVTTQTGTRVAIKEETDTDVSETCAEPAGPKVLHRPTACKRHAERGCASPAHLQQVRK